jgi:hypothetical protein
MKYPDCKKEMELVVPDDSENYWKCPLCRLEITEGEEE